MKVLRSGLDIDAFFAAPRSRPRVLFLDYDGTLAPFCIDPAHAMPYEEVIPLLFEATSAPGARVVIVSGRRIEDLEGPLSRLPHTEVWASHGWERAQGGVVARRIPPCETRQGLAIAARAVTPLLKLGARLENKLASVALHWRGLPDATITALKLRARQAWQPFVSDELALLHFDGGFELRARARSKGHAVRQVMSECGSNAVSAYLGDDLTDEDGFRAVQPLGLAVLVRPQHRTTAAQLWLRPPGELAQFLRRWNAGA